MKKTILFWSVLISIMFIIYTANATQDNVIISAMSLLGAERSYSCYAPPLLEYIDGFDEGLVVYNMLDDNEYKYILYKGDIDFLCVQMDYSKKITSVLYIIDETKEDAFIGQLSLYIQTYNRESKTALRFLDRAAKAIHLGINEYCTIVYNPYLPQVEYTYTFSSGNVYRITGEGGKIINISISYNSFVNKFCH